MGFPLLSRRTCTRCLTLTRTLATSHPPRLFPPGHIAFAIDIDGVLLRGPEPHPSAKRALAKLQENDIPFILLTNGGGISEAARCEDLSSKLDFPIAPSQLIQSHTPVKGFAEVYETVLVVGGEGENCRKVAEEYGFKNVFIPEDFYATDPGISPFSTSLPPEYARNVPRGTKIDAIFVFNDPRDWALNAQLVIDLIRSDNGVYGTLAEPQAKEHIPTYFTNTDLVWASQYHIPRLGQGAFKFVVEALAHRFPMPVGGPRLRPIGKPSSHTFRYAQKLLTEALVAKLKEKSPELEFNEVTHGLASADALADAAAAEVATSPPPADHISETTSEEESSPNTEVEAAAAQVATSPPPADPTSETTPEEESSPNTEVEAAAAPDTANHPPSKPPRQPAILKRVYMIGDNPESDVLGANRASYQGTSWWSLLVRSGVWREPQPTRNPIAIVDDVLAAVDWAMENEQKIKDGVELKEYPRAPPWWTPGWKKGKFYKTKRFTPGSGEAKAGEGKGGESADSKKKKTDKAMKGVKGDDALGKKADGEGGSDSV
ncbi:unnamed protein product [Tuber aestivum]|uniref:Uncharacterized protein n=1 Tax=Tuber aestivum TaxID=59557 RepID=A0A292Q909_9PEZI|nr:unnamed protein product [Tuber aestivum]